MHDYRNLPTIHFRADVFLFTNFPIHFQILSPAVKVNCMLKVQEEKRKLHLLITSFLIVRRILETESVLIKAESIDLNQCMESCVFCLYLPNMIAI